MADLRVVDGVRPANFLTPLVAAGAVLTLIYLPAVTPFLSAGQLASVGPWLALLVAILTAGILIPQVGKWIPFWCAVALLSLTQLVSIQIDAKSKRLEAVCGDLQKQMKIDNPHAANAAAIFTAYGCRPRWR